MSDRSQTFHRGRGNNRFFSGTPNQPNHYQGLKQPLHLAPNSPHLSPGGYNKQSGFSNDSPSQDFIPIGNSSPLNIYRNTPNKSWNQSRSNSSWNKERYSQYHSRSSFDSSTTSPRSSGSSSYSPYNKFSSNRGRGRFQNTSNNIPISSYCDKSMLDDPWAECERELIEKGQNYDKSSSDADLSSGDNDC